MVLSPRLVVIGIASLAVSLAFPATAAPAGALPDPPANLPTLPGDPTVGVTPGGDGATVDVGAGDKTLQVGAGSAGVTLKQGSRASRTPAAGPNDSFPVGIPPVRPGRRAQTSSGGGPSAVVFGPPLGGKAAAARGAKGANGSAARPRSTTVPSARSRSRATPSDSSATRHSPFFALVDRIPGLVKAGIAALALMALAIWAAWVRARRRLAHNAFVDPVTGIANAPAFEGLLAGELERAKRYKRPLALLVLELSDARRSFLPLLDQTLRDVTGVIQERLREGDIIARLGPSRFGIICPEATTTAGETLARALEARLEEMRVRVAVGTAERQPTDLGPEQIMSRAEQGLAAHDPGPQADRERRRALLRVA
jgi:diguanylate cyclase (GGDEF)-like protein